MFDIMQILFSSDGRAGKAYWKPFSTGNSITRQLNGIESDVERICALEAAKNQPNAFIIVDKANSRADLYRGGEPIDRFEVAVGQTEGDSLNTVYYSDGKLSKTGKTTPPGQYFTMLPYTLNIVNKRDFQSGDNIDCLVLNGVQHPADFKYKTAIGLHKIPNSCPERLNMLDIKDARRSLTTGCVNFMPNDFCRMVKKINPKGTSIYILPEDPGNKLEVVLLPNGLWMKPKYANDKEENMFLDAMEKFFGLK